MKNKRLTIYDIKYLLGSNAGHFFDRKTLAFFGQTLKTFSVKKVDETHYLISAPMYLGKGGQRCYVENDGKRQYLSTERIYNAETNRLEKVPQ